MHAYCYASGQIEFGKTIPTGALPVASGREKPLRNFIIGVARHGYQTEIVDGRPTKIPGTDCLLVPGIPEAPDQEAALDALLAFKNWIRGHNRAGITV